MRPGAGEDAQRRRAGKSGTPQTARRRWLVVYCALCGATLAKMRADYVRVVGVCRGCVEKIGVRG